MVAGDEGVDHIEVMRRHAVHRRNLASLNDNARLGVVGRGERRKPVRRIFDGELVQPQRPLVPIGETLPAVGGGIGHG